MSAGHMIQGTQLGKGREQAPEQAWMGAIPRKANEDP